MCAAIVGLFAVAACAKVAADGTPNDAGVEASVVDSAKCDELVTTARKELAQFEATADKSCAVDGDCVFNETRLSCVSGCGSGLFSKAGAAEDGGPFLARVLLERIVHLASSHARRNGRDGESREDLEAV